MGRWRSNLSRIDVESNWLKRMELEEASDPHEGTAVDWAARNGVVTECSQEKIA